MSGPLYVGFLVEEWSDALVEDVKRALPAAIRAGWSDSEPECFELVVHEHQGAAWLRVEDSRAGTDPAQVGTAAGEPLAQAIAKAARSATWLYEYNSVSSFSAVATRISKVGEAGSPVEATEDTEVPPELEDDPAFDFGRYAQDLLGAAIRLHVRWKPELLRTRERDEGGPAIVSHVAGKAHPLAPYFKSDEESARAPAVAHKLGQLLDKLEADCARATRTLDGIVAVLEGEEPDLDRFLARSRDDRLQAAFDPALDTLRSLAEALAETRLAAISLPIGEKDAKRLEHQQTTKGAPKTRADLVERLKVAQAGLARDNLFGLAHTVRFGRGGAKEKQLIARQLKLVRLLLHVAHLALLEGEDILRARA